MLYRSALLIGLSCALAQAQSSPGVTLLSDDFTQDSVLNPSLWGINTPLVATLAASMMPAIPMQTVFAEVKFSGDGMTVSGTSNPREFLGFQSRQLFTPPFTVQAVVMGAKAFANPFALQLVGKDTGRFLNISGNVNPANAPAYKIGVNLKGQPTQALIPDPSENKWYTLTIVVDSAGQAAVQATDSAGHVGKVEHLAFGTEPAYLVISQNEPSPKVVGPNVAIWRNIAVVRGTLTDVLALNRRPAPPDRGPVLRGFMLPAPTDAATPELKPPEPSARPSGASHNQIVATFTGHVLTLDDGMNLFGGGSSDFRLDWLKGHRLSGPDVRLVYTWNDTGEDFGAICKESRGLSSKSPPSATASVVLTIGNESFAFGQLPNLHADMGRYVEGTVPHITEIEVLLREGGKTIDSYFVPMRGAAVDIHLRMAARQLAGSCDWRESFSAALNASATFNINEGLPRANTQGNLALTNLVISGLVDSRSKTPTVLSAARQQNPIIGLWRNKSTNSFMRLPDLEFTATEEISDGRRYPVTYTMQGDSVFVIEAHFNRRCKITGPDQMTCTAPIASDVELVRMR
jgi:hypothetical protein